MEARGLGPDELGRANPALVHVSITPFGSDGPAARFAATDLIVHAASGGMLLNGEPDRAPLRPGGVSAWTYAGVEAAGAALVAHFERVRSGRGQHVDVSAQLSTGLAAAFTLLAERIGAPRTRRSGGGLALGSVRVPFIWEAADGYVSLTLAFDPPNAAFLRRLFDWLIAEGALGPDVLERQWGPYLGAILAGQAERTPFDALVAGIAGFLRARTKAELLCEACARELLLVPVATLDDVLASPQLAARGFWHELETAGTNGPLRVPGAFARLSRTPLRAPRPAPRVGEHTPEVLGEAPRAARATAAGGPGGLPLAGLRVLDFMWVMAGPYATRVLADYGATVVKLESAGRLDYVRVLPPFYGGQPGPERSASFGSINAGKRSLSLDLRRPEAREIVLDLVRWAEVVTESFAPGALQRLGLDYERLRAVKPDLVMLSTCLFGQTGPLASMAGYGTMGAALAGLVQPTGWPDRAPAGPFGPYTDWMAPRFTVPVLLAALDHRRRTGEGQYIDQSQVESALHFLAPHLLAAQAGGGGLDRVANRDPELAPHGAYPAAGEDAWVAIAARDDADFQRLCAVMGRLELAADPRFDAAARRRANAAALDAELADWTCKLPAEAIEQRLQAAGVPAHGLMHPGRAAGDPQLAARGLFVEAEHAELGRVLVESSRFRLSRTPARVERAGPVLGQDTEVVLRELLGYDAARVAALRAAGALG
jgi:crotonobetainyl-CoA:carnitine CoA-transferase CaiB-like acyl-CoA transferase